METAIYYLLCAMTLGGALGVILARGYVNAAMSMLLSMLGAAGMMVMMGAYFVAFIMVSVYAGAVLVLFVFVVMLMGEEKDGAGLGKKLALAGLWVLLGAFIGWASPAFLGDAALRAGFFRSGFRQELRARAVFRIHASLPNLRRAAFCGDARRNRNRQAAALRKRGQIRKNLEIWTF